MCYTRAADSLSRDFIWRPKPFVLNWDLCVVVPSWHLIIHEFCEALLAKALLPYKVGHYAQLDALLLFGPQNRQWFKRLSPSCMR